MCKKRRNKGKESTYFQKGHRPWIVDRVKREDTVKSRNFTRSVCHISVSLSNTVETYIHTAIYKNHHKFFILPAHTNTAFMERITQ